MPHLSKIAFSLRRVRARAVGARLTLVAIVILADPVCADAAVAVESGDVLRVVVLNAPEFSREDVPVDADGAIALPTLGHLIVAGLGTEAVAANVAQALENRGLIVAPAVLVEVAAYRPAYVGGSVEAPGAIDYTPGLTVRKAMIAAGGLRRPAAAGATEGDGLTVLATRSSVAFALAQTEMRIARLETELARTDTMPEEPSTEGLLSARETAAVANLETALLTDRRAAQHATDAHATQMQALVVAEIDTLSRQAALQAEEDALQLAEIEDARTLVEKGLMPRPRLQEMLREQSRLRRDQLETDAYSARARQTSETLRYEQEREALRLREETRLALQETQRMRAALQAELAALDLRALAAGFETAAPETAPSPSFTIFRTTNRMTTRIEVTPDTPVLPGDVLEVTLATSRPPGPAPTD